MALKMKNKRVMLINQLLQCLLVFLLSFWVFLVLQHIISSLKRNNKKLLTQEILWQLAEKVNKSTFIAHKVIINFQAMMAKTSRWMQTIWWKTEITKRIIGIKCQKVFLKSIRLTIQDPYTIELVSPMEEEPMMKRLRTMHKVNTIPAMDSSISRSRRMSIWLLMPTETSHKNRCKWCLNFINKWRATMDQR